MKIQIIYVLLFSVLLENGFFFTNHAGALPKDCILFSLDTTSSSFSYEAKHPAHKVQGIYKTEKEAEEKAEGKLCIYPSGTAQAAIKIPVMPFDSNNANRDMHMNEAVEAARFKYIELKVASTNIPIPTSTSFSFQKPVKALLSFHGVTKLIEPNFIVTIQFKNENTIEADGQFQISLKDFNIKPPELLLVPIQDKVLIKAHLVFKRG